MEKSALGATAVIRYLDGDFEIIRPGTHVVCAVTGDLIPLQELRYWNVDMQEPYRDADVSLDAWKRMHNNVSSD